MNTKETGEPEISSEETVPEQVAEGQTQVISDASQTGAADVSEESSESEPEEPEIPKKDPLEAENTAEIAVSDSLIDQVIGQDHAVEVIRKAASQRRHVMMIGTPGTGKSMLAKAMAELLPVEDLQDTMVYPNSEDSNNPIVRTVKAGRGKEIVTAHKAEARKRIQTRNTLVMILILGIVGYSLITMQWLMGIIAAAFIFMALQYSRPKDEAMIPKLLVANKAGDLAPYVDGTGSHAGALLGDVRHDPFQSGGLETPAHDRVEAGAIHRANKGVLFIDEINTMTPHSQQNLLTALQEGEFSITGQSERSSGAMVRTEPVPCRFVMIAAGNQDAVQNMHPALRSRIRGYGYEVYMQEKMPDTEENQKKFIRFVAQEVRNDGKIPHFNRGAIDEVLREARRRANRKGYITLKLREMGGLIRVAGDLARADGSELTTTDHVITAKTMAKSVEGQAVDEYIKEIKQYDLVVTEGEQVGRVNGLAVVGEDAGNVLPIVAEVTHTQSKMGGQVIATGLLQEIAQESIQNISAIVKNYTGKEIRDMDIHIQFLNTHGVEGDSASVTVATAVISAIEKIPVRQDTAMTGSLSVRGEVLPIGGVTYKIEAAAKAGIKRVIIPRSNLDDVLIEDRFKSMVEIIPVESVEDVLENAFAKDQAAEYIKSIRDSSESRKTTKIFETVFKPAAGV